MKVTKQESNFYVFCGLYFPQIDRFDCIRTVEKVIKHAGGTYSGDKIKDWENSDLYYNIFSQFDRKKVFFATYIFAFGSHRGVRKAYQRVSKELNYILFHASIMLMRKKGIIPTTFSFLDYEKLSYKKNDIHW